MKIKTSITSRLENRALRWQGYVIRIGEEMWPKKTVNWSTRRKRRKGRSDVKWKAYIAKTMEEKEPNKGNWKDRILESENDKPIKGKNQCSEQQHPLSDKGELTLEEALQLAYSEDLDVANIYVEPLDGSQLTNEDWEDEDDGDTIDNLSPNQLRAATELQVFQKEEDEQNLVPPLESENSKASNCSDCKINANYQNVVGKAAAPLLTMIDEIDESKKKLRYGGAGTMRDNRIPLPNKKEMKKSQRESYASLTDKANGVMVTRYNDNNTVTIGSTVYGVNPLSEVKRFSQANTKNIQISRPFSVGQYNSSVGSTDLMNENISRHRIGIRGKKWWWNLFT
ncbi:hypothetical protein ILUMI_24632 [Ignelater luminosus]|uniref:PiggyBac transposable element-derived protein domain-containing protein n=1 Tax=Ignelater luminosus TaxID=2038154 RepID=A0A8K0CC64_IGNLU|nr:hypothetical protein ILUMI_24632 [Ignelater luminosus]